MLEHMARGSLQDFVRYNGGSETLCFGGNLKEDISSELIFGENGYRFTLSTTTDGKMVVASEQTSKQGDWRSYAKGMREEARLFDWKGDGGISGITEARNVCGHIHDAVSSWRVYHFHDTSEKAPLRQPGIVGGDKRLLQDGSNIAPLLLYLRQKHKDVYRRIVETIRVVAPFFIDFSLEVEKNEFTDREICRLRWQQKGAERLMQAWQFSDGTLRFIALTVALMQPTPPSTILIDEPELGLHPRALSVFRGLLHEAANRMQVIVTTQSPALLNSMEPDEIVVVGRTNGASTFHRLVKDELDVWLNDYTLEELWRKNVIQAGPDYE